MNIKATEQIASTNLKLLNSILNIPSEPNTIPITINASNNGNPNLLLKQLHIRQSIIIIAHNINKVSILSTFFLIYNFLIIQIL